MEFGIKLSTGVFPVLDDFRKNPEKTLKRLASVGYEGIELYGNFIHSPKVIREICQQYQLDISGAQTSWRYLNHAHLQEVMDYNYELGNKNIIISALGGPWESGHKKTENTISTWLSHAEKMNELQEVVSQNGFTLSYHTHDYDFGEKIEGKQTSFELIFQNTNQLVGIEVDTGSSIKGKQCPQKLIKALGKRAHLVHCKPIREDDSFDVNLGEPNDVNDWKEILTACLQAGTQWLVVEPENKLESGLTALTKSYQNIASLMQAEK